MEKHPNSGVTFFRQAEYFAGRNAASPSVEVTHIV
jgi:hypothetical protein